MIYKLGATRQSQSHSRIVAGSRGQCKEQSDKKKSMKIQ